MCPEQAWASYGDIKPGSLHLHSTTCMPNSINGGLFSKALMESGFPAAQVRGRGRVRVRVGVKVRVRVGGYG